jgi:hypothetical protein
VDNKKLAQTAQKILKEQGHDLPLGHVYELFSKLSGVNSYNVAKAKNVQFAQVLPGPDREKIVALGTGGDLFDVKIKTSYDGEVTKFYRISAHSETQARQIIEEYLEYAHGNKDSDKHQPTYPQVEQLIHDELDVADFSYSNWEMIDSVPYEAKIETVYPVNKETTESVWRMYKLTGDRMSFKA